MNLFVYIFCSVFSVLQFDAYGQVFYHTLEYVLQPRFRQMYSPFVNTLNLNEDQSRMMVTISQGSIDTDLTKMIDSYSITDGNITFVQTFVVSQRQTATPLMKTNKNISLMAFYLSTYKRVKIYRRNDTRMELLQQFNPTTGSVAMDTLQFSADGKYLNTGIKSTKALISFVFDGTSYVSNYPATLLPTVSQLRILTLDGQFIVYGDISTPGSCILRVLKNDATLLQVYSKTFASGSVATVVRVNFLQSGMPSSGIYDIILNYRFDSAYYTVYIQFQNSTLAGSVIQTIPNDAITSQTSVNIVQNGKYLTTIDAASTALGLPITFKLWEKQSNGSFALIYNVSRFIYPTMLYMAQDASLIALRRNQSGLVIFLFKCDIINCQKCRWKNICQKCSQGFILENNACVCGSGKYNLSGTCIDCNLSNCSSCTSNNICSSCVNGYSLVSNACVCSIGRNISTVTGNCVSCSIPNCHKCSIDDICDLYVPLDFSNMTNQVIERVGVVNDEINNINGQLQRVKIVMILLSFVGMILLIGTVILCWKLFSYRNSTKLNPILPTDQISKINQSTELPTFSHSTIIPEPISPSHPIQRLIQPQRYPPLYAPRSARTPQISIINFDHQLDIKQGLQKNYQDNNNNPLDNDIDWKQFKAEKSRRKKKNNYTKQINEEIIFPQMIDLQ